MNASFATDANTASLGSTPFYVTMAKIGMGYPIVLATVLYGSYAASVSGAFNGEPAILGWAILLFLILGVSLYPLACGLTLVLWAAPRFRRLPLDTALRVFGLVLPASLFWLLVFHWDVGGVMTWMIEG